MDIAFQIIGKRIEGNGFGSNGIRFFTGFVNLRTQNQRTDTERIPESQHAVSCNHGYYAVCAAHQTVHFGNGVKNIVDGELVRNCIFRDFAAQFMREYIE